MTPDPGDQATEESLLGDAAELESLARRILRTGEGCGDLGANAQLLLVRAIEAHAEFLRAQAAWPVQSKPAQPELPAGRIAY